MLNNPLTIRPANFSDLGAIVDILKESGCISPVNDKSLSSVVERVLKNLARGNDTEGHSILVAENQNGEVVGFIGVHWLQYLMASDIRGYVSELFVLKSARGRGIGRRLLEFVKEQALERGSSRLMVVNVPNRITYPRRFFLNLAWKERQEITNFILPIGKKT